MAKTLVELPEIDLKHYSKHLKKLKTYANALGIKIIYKKNPISEGVYVHTRNLIYIEKELSESTEIAVLLHELGHAIDTDFMTPKRCYKIEKAYDAAEKGKLTTYNRRIILKCERDAWNRARLIARRLKIKLGKWFDEAEEVCLDSYKKYKK